jgi:hypothetical protein
MKVMLTFLIVMMCLQSMGQTPPPIRKRTGNEGSSPQNYIPVKKGTFRHNTSFVKNQRYYSEDNRYCMVFQEDGNLVVYKMMSQNSFKAIWNTHTNGKAVQSCVFQQDGNLVMYDYTGKAVWNSNTDARNRKLTFNDSAASLPWQSWMTLQNDGNLVVYGNYYPYTDMVMWFSGSYEKN